MAVVLGGGVGGRGRPGVVASDHLLGLVGGDRGRLHRRGQRGLLDHHLGGPTGKHEGETATCRCIKWVKLAT